MALPGREEVPMSAGRVSIAIADFIISDVTAHWPGSVYDSRIFQQYSLNR